MGQRRRPTHPTWVVAVCAAVLLGCTADDFHDLAEGDCTDGAPRIEGTLERIDCDGFSSSNPNHHRVTKVADDDPDAQCPIGSVGYEDRDRFVCFSR